MTIFLRRAAFALVFLFVFSIPWQDVIRLQGFGSISRLLGFVAFGVTALATFRGGALHLRRLHLMLVGLILFTLYGVASYLWSVDPSATVRKIITYAQLVAMVWLVWEHSRTSRSRHALMQAYVLGGFVTVAIGLFAFLGAEGFRRTGGINANDFAMVTVVAIPIAWYLALRSRQALGPAFWINLLYLPAALLAVILSASRGGLIMTVVALTVVPLTLGRLSVLRRASLLVFTVAMVWALFTYLPSAFPDLTQNLERLETTSSELREGTLSNRRIIWNAGMQVVADNPVTGIGLGAFASSIESIYGKAASAHSSFLSVLAELGIVGILIYGGLLAVAVIPGFFRSTPARIYFLVLFATLIVGMTPLDKDDDKSVWFVLALLASEWPVVLVFPNAGAASGDRLDAAPDRLPAPSGGPSA